MKRRLFLTGSGAVAISGLLSGCRGQQQSSVNVQVLKGSIPVQLVNEFRKQLKQSAGLEVTAQNQLQDLFGLLQAWQQKPQQNDWWLNLPLPFVDRRRAIPIADLVTLGDYWLAVAISSKSIQPLDPTQLGSWQQLPPQWQQLVRRNDRGLPDPKGKIWGAPYRWGSTVIAYRRDKFESNGWKPPTDWGDLWREELRDRISVLDRPREAIGLILKKLGHSYNTENIDKIPKLKQELLALHKQAKFYSSNAYLQPLILGDTYLAVGWSTDILPVMQRYRNIAAVVPQSGTALWADLWVRPANADSDLALVQNWIDFCWQPNTARFISRFTEATSPILAGNNAAELAKTERNQVILPAPEIIKKSDFLLPLSQKTLQDYKTLWEARGKF